MGMCRKMRSKSRNFLVEFCKFHNSRITNTIFKNNHGQQTTCTLPLPPSFLHNNPYRKQMDYILFKRGNILKYLTRNHLIEISQGLIISKKLMQKSKSNRFIQKKAKKSKKNPTGTKYFNLNKLTDSRKL